jgi:hypothetical protein
MKPNLTIDLLCEEAHRFAQIESSHDEPEIFGVTDGKAVGTYLEHKFQRYLHTKYDYIEGSSAKGIDFPELLVDMKVTSIRQPQSSCPFKSARQKIFGLGYSCWYSSMKRLTTTRIKLVASILNIPFLSKANVRLTFK